MTLQFSLNINKKMSSKLQCLKALKNLGGLGLKEAKEIIDDIDRGHKRYVNIVNYDLNDIELLRENNIIVSDREDNINDLLIKYLVNIYTANIIVKIFDGSFDVKDNVLTLDIKDGEFIHQVSHEQRELKKTKMTFDFSTCIIEEYA
jgi:hypothetical protein